MPETWTPTAKMRWYHPKSPTSDTRLQQLWVKSGWRSQWRDIECVVEGEEQDNYDTID